MTVSSSLLLIGILLTGLISSIQDTQTKSQPPTSQKEATPTVREVKVTNGPVVQSLTDTTAVITWSTNVSADTLLHYGKNSDNLDRVEREPWGGLTHRVRLIQLTPDTTYYYRVGTSAVQAAEPMAATASFRTRPAKRAP